MRFRPLRRLYHWTIGWADRPAGAIALFAIAFAESSFFPIPPDVLLVALGLGAPARAHVFALITTVGSVLGGIAGYGIGILATGLAESLLRTFATEATLHAVEAQLRDNAFLYIAIAGFTPIPYKVFTITAGVFRLDFPTFVAASVCSRGARFALEGLLVRRFGARARDFLERRFEWVTLVAGAVLVGGFLAVRYLF